MSVIGTLAREFPDRRLGAQGEEFPRQYARVQIVQFGASRHLTGRFGVAGASFVAAEARPPMNGNIPGASGIWAVKFGWSGVFALAAGCR